MQGKYYLLFYQFSKDRQIFNDGLDVYHIKPTYNGF